MKKTTLLLLAPLCFLYAEMDESTQTKAWSRDDVIRSVEDADKAREDMARKLEKSSNKIMTSRDGLKPIDEDDSEKELNDEKSVRVEANQNLKVDDKNSTKAINHKASIEVVNSIEIVQIKPKVHYPVVLIKAK